MTLRRACLPLAVALAVAAGAPRAGAGEALFDFYLSGIRVGEVTLRTELSGDTYTATGRISGAGIVGAFTDYFFAGTSTGSVLADGTVVPGRFVGESRSPRDDRRTEIDWRDGTPVHVSVEPPRKSAPDPAGQGGTLDPVSASFALLRDAPPEQVCNTSVDVFDGSRRSRLQIGPQEVDADDISCAGTYARLEGEAHALSSQTEYPFRVVFRTNGSGLAELERIETRTRVGKAVIARRS